MLPVLIVAATYPEIKPFLDNIGTYNTAESSLFKGQLRSIPIEILVTGIGSVATTFHATAAFCQNKYALAISVGIAGTFSDKLRIGEIVQIEQDCFADLGIDNRGIFQSLPEAGLMNEDSFPFVNSNLINTKPIHSSYRLVNGVTVNTASGSEERISNLMKRYSPQVETMENAAFFYTCLMLNIPFASFRAISNKVESRNKNAWNIPLAVEQLNHSLFELIENLPI